MSNLIDAPFLRTDHYTRDGADEQKAVENWHTDAHTGAFWLCMEQPCHAVQRSA